MNKGQLIDLSTAELSRMRDDIDGILKDRVRAREASLPPPPPVVVVAAPAAAPPSKGGQSKFVPLFIGNGGPVKFLPETKSIREIQAEELAAAKERQAKQRKPNAKETTTFRFLKVWGLPPIGRLGESMTEREEQQSRATTGAIKKAMNVFNKPMFDEDGQNAIAKIFVPPGTGTAELTFTSPMWVMTAKAELLKAKQEKRLQFEGVAACEQFERHFIKPRDYYNKEEEEVESR